MAYGWGINEPVIKPLEEGGDNINQYAQKIKDALDTLYVELRQDIVRATLAESIAATDINKIITPSTAFRTYYGEGEPSNLQGKNNDTYIRYGNVKDTYIKVSGAWQKIDAVPQPATLAEVNAGTVTTKYVTPETMNLSNKSDLPGGFPRLDSSGLLPRQYIPTRMAFFTSSGSWTCPAGVTKVLVSGCAGGGGGGGNTNATTNCKGGPGGAGGHCVDYLVNVTPGQTYTITIGAGGTGGSRLSSGGTGGITSFGSLLSMSGGEGGGYPGGSSTGDVGTYGANGSGVVGGGYDNAGSGLFGKVGATRTSNGSGNNGTGYGAGGSGSYGTSTNYVGGKGAPGLLIIKWVQ